MGENSIAIASRLLLILALLLDACSSLNDNAPAPISSSAANSIASYALSLIGTKYKYGGNSPDKGFDCSGFVDHVFNRTLGINLPRSSYDMSRIGRKIQVDELHVGDLVFFNTLRRKYSHVGIYLGSDRFIHAPSDGGNVRTEDIREPYWKNHYNGARRITLHGRALATLSMPVPTGTRPSHKNHCCYSA